MSSVHTLARRSVRRQGSVGYGVESTLTERLQDYFVVTNGVVFQYTETGAIFNKPKVYVVYDAASDTSYEEPGYFVEGPEAAGYIANVAPGGIYNELKPAKVRAKTFVKKVSGGGEGGEEEPTPAPVIAPPATVPEEDSKFWQETWFLATVGTVVAGGVGYGIWRYTRAKRST